MYSRHNEDTRVLVYDLLKASSGGLTQKEIDKKLGRHCHQSTLFLVRNNHAVVDKIVGEGRSKQRVYKATDVAPHAFRIISKYFTPDEAKLKTFFDKSASEISNENNVSMATAGTFRDLAHLLANENLNEHQKSLLADAVRMVGFGQVTRAKQIIRPVMVAVLGGRSSPKGRTHQQKKLHDRFQRTLDVLFTICDGLSGVPIPAIPVEDRAALAQTLQAACRNISKFRIKIGGHHV